MSDCSAPSARFAPFRKSDLWNSYRPKYTMRSPKSKQLTQSHEETQRHSPFFALRPWRPLRLSVKPVRPSMSCFTGSKHWGPQGTEPPRTFPHGVFSYEVFSLTTRLPRGSLYLLWSVVRCQGRRQQSSVGQGTDNKDLDGRGRAGNWEKRCQMVGTNP